MDSVSNIHKRWSFTRLNPSSGKTSFLISLLTTSALVVITDVYILNFKVGIQLFTSTLVGILVLIFLDSLDFWSLRHTPLGKLSKVFHLSAFSSLLWAGTVLIGVISHNLLFPRIETPFSYVTEGMFFAIGLRFAIFKSVFGASTKRAIAISFIAPVVLFIAFVPSPNYFLAFAQPIGLIFGSILLATSILWIRLADKAGRPYVTSTFNLLRAFLTAWTDGDASKMENITEANSYEHLVTTYLLRFFITNSSDPIHIILPDIHPGPFSPIGGSNLPYELYMLMSKKALVMHSVSDHSLNIPSKAQLDKYLKSLCTAEAIEQSTTCSTPIQVRISEATVTGLKFGDTVIVFLSMAPTGMEDVPETVLEPLKKYSSSLGYRHILVVDSHNAIGSVLDEKRRCTLLTASKECLEKLKDSKEYPFKMGFANLGDIPHGEVLRDDLGQAGLATVIFSIDNRHYAIGWADSNNMQKNLREHIISSLETRGIDMLDVCTSDTHSTSGKRTHQGYYPLGSRSRPQDLAEIFYHLSKKSIENSLTSNSFKYQLLSTQTKIDVMGKKQFHDFSMALDRSMFVTKIFLGITALVFTSMLIFS